MLRSEVESKQNDVFPLRFSRGSRMYPSENSKRKLSFRFFTFSRRCMALILVSFLVSFLIISWTFRLDVGRHLQGLQFPDYIKTAYKHLKSIGIPDFSASGKSLNFQDFFNMTQNQHPGFLIYTSGCRIPDLDPWDPSVRNLIEKREPYKCTGDPLFLRSAPNGSIILNRSALRILCWKASQVVCNYQGIRRLHEQKGGKKREENYKLEPAKPLRFAEDLAEDYVKVTCKTPKTKKYEHFFPLVRLKKSVEQVKSSFHTLPTKLNVILIAIDSVSKLNFQRHFHRTRTFLKEKLLPFEMKGYTKVGENTFPNLIPLLTGHFHESYFNESVRNTLFWDRVDLIWKHYAENGFKTFYAEDMPLFGTFQYEKRGFYDPPTDYYYRPMALAVHFSQLKKRSKTFCFNSQIDMDIIYNYLRDFTVAMEDMPFFAFAMVSTITHDYLNNAAYADEPTFRLLNSLYDNGTLNKSVLVFFSDHGLRFGPIRETFIGKFEERLPFMFIHFPKWFLEKNPKISNNLQTNQRRLITLFDVHETVLDLIAQTRDVPINMNSSERLGSSLLEEISENRTCSEANIRQHWCPCQTFESVPLNDSFVKKMAQAITDTINEVLQDHQAYCAFLEISDILDARQGNTDDLLLRFKKKDEHDSKKKTLKHFLITLETRPGNGKFEGTVQYDPTQKTTKVLGISRINMYGNQSLCIDIHELKIFCFCTSQTSRNISTSPAYS